MARIYHTMGVVNGRNNISSQLSQLKMITKITKTKYIGFPYSGDTEASKYIFFLKIIIFC
jgi:hypothetical protein